MLSQQSVQHFQDICAAVRAKAIEAGHQLIGAAKGEAVSRGMSLSSSAILTMDKAAAEAFRSAVPQIIYALDRLSAAEPVKDAQARRLQLRKLVEEEMRALGQVVLHIREEHWSYVRRGLQRDWVVNATESAIEAAVKEALGRIGLSVMTQSNAAAAPSSVVHSPTFHAPVGAYQIGDANAASVEQSIVNNSPPEQVIAALGTLIEALRGAQGMPPEQREDVVAALEQIRDEAGKPAPNKFTLGRLLSGVSDTVQAIGAAPQAWAVVEGWYEALKSIAS